MLDFEQFDRRHYPTVSVREGYREWLPSYEATVADEMDLALLDALDSVPWSSIERAADLGCGTGRTGAWLHARGIVHIDGIDVTPEMLAVARARRIYASLREADVAATGLEGGRYGLVTTCLVDEHLRLTLTEMREGVIGDSWIALKPAWDRYRGFPISFVMVWRKP